MFGSDLDFFDTILDYLYVLFIVLGHVLSNEPGAEKAAFLCQSATYIIFAAGVINHGI